MIWIICSKVVITNSFFLILSYFLFGDWRLG